MTANLANELEFEDLGFNQLSDNPSGGSGSWPSFSQARYRRVPIRSDGRRLSGSCHVRGVGSDSEWIFGGSVEVVR